RYDGLFLLLLSRNLKRLEAQLMADRAEIEAELQTIQQLASLGRLDAAEACCRELLQKAPAEAEAWSWSGLLMSARGRWLDAELVFRRALELNPNNPHYWTYLSAALSGQKR